MTSPTGAARREGRRQRWQGEPPPWPLAALRAAGASRACPLPPPRGATLDRTGGRVGGLVEPVATLAQGTCLAPLGQAADRAQALPALGHDRPEQAADTLRGCPGHGRYALAWASVAGGKVPPAVLHLAAAMGGDGHTVRGAAERVAHVRGAWERPLGGDAPRLGRERVGAAPPALGWSQGGGLCRAHQGLCEGAGGQRVEARATADRAPGLDGKEATRRGGAPACLRLRQGSPWHQTGQGGRGSERLIPGVHDVDATTLAPQMLAAARAPGRAGSPPEPCEAGACVGQDAGMERMRERQDAVARRHGQERGWAVCDPRRLGQGVTRGAVAMAACVRGRALTAARGTLGGVAPAGRGTTDEESVPHLVLARQHTRGGAGGRTRVPPDVGTFPRRSAWGLPRCPGGTPGGVRRHDVTLSAGLG
jgi:hypothetical protein